MNKSQARKILGLDGTEDEREIKKKYRKLMHAKYTGLTAESIQHQIDHCNGIVI